jgi:hypothetical protein
LKWLRVAILIVIVVLTTIPIVAGTVVNVTYQPRFSGGITGLTITYITDTDMQLDWAIVAPAVNIMIRAKYGEYPDDIPDVNTAPTDGYLVYYGNGVTTHDTSMNFDENPGALYYAAWGQRADGKWIMLKLTGLMESEVMTLLAIVGFCLGMTYLSFKTSYAAMKFFAGMTWIGLMLYWITNPPTAIPAGTPAHQALTVIFIGIALAVAFMGGGQGYTKETNGEKTEGFRFQVPKFLRGENQDENGNERPVASRRDKMSEYMNRVNNTIEGRRANRR